MPAALVTGSAKGIGKAILLALARDGYDVAVHYRSSQKEALAVAQEAAAYGITAVTLQADVTKPKEAEELVKLAATSLGGLDVLINNVGNYRRGPLSELDADSWLELFGSNLNATFYTCQAAVPMMRDHGGGRIINLGYAGAQAFVARPDIAAYAIAKMGVILYSKALAKDNAAYGMTVNVVSPGVMDNSVTKPLAEIPMGRAGELSELVGAVRYLLSPEARYVTGITLEVAGGWNL